MELPQRKAGAELAAGWTESGTEVKVDTLTLLRLRDQMKQQLMEYRTAIQSDQENDLDELIEQNFIVSAIRVLWKDAEKVKVAFKNKTLALQRIQVALALRNKVNENDNESRHIMETMKHIINLSKEVSECQQEAREKERKLSEFKRKRLSLKEEEAQKLQRIHTMMKKQEKEANTEIGKKLEKIKTNLQKEREMTTIIQNVFQNIIIASRVNWAEDPSLKAIVLQLEKNVNFL
ncbi:centromere protein H [Colius striatus]|uniref:centromere protein H n=1 Tax=Colius striatus TaxID=57412 RepID=UPI002B1D5B88|nr:centromere protein H [Colius striatus]